MKTIEERAKEYARIALSCKDCGDEYTDLGCPCKSFNHICHAFIDSAKEQRKIDAKLIATYFSDLMADMGYVPKNIKEE